MYTRESIENLRRFVDLKDILVSIGGVSSTDIIESSYELRCACPLHNGDQKTGFSWKKADGIWSCFTKQCGEQELTRDVFGFVSKKLGVSFLDAVELLANKYNFNLEQSQARINTKMNLECATRSKFIIDKLDVLHNLPGYSNDKMDLALIIEYLKSRNYKDLETISAFNLYPCIDPIGKLRLGIPSYDDDGNLVGVNARRLDGILDYTEEDPKYRLIKGYKKGSVLYNLQAARRNSIEDGLILVEGELSTIRMTTYGYNNTVGYLGNTLSNQQISLLYKYAFKVVFLIEEGEAAEKGIFSSIKKLIPNTMRIGITYLEKGDPDDNSRENIEKAMSTVRYISPDKHAKLINIGT